MAKSCHGKPSAEVKTTFFMLNSLIMKFILLINVKMSTILLINVKMPTIVGILTFISMKNTTPESFKARKSFIFQHFSLL